METCWLSCSSLLTCKTHACIRTKRTPRLRLCLNLSHATALSGSICSQSRTRSRSCVRVGLSCHFPSVFDPRYYLKRCDKIWWFCATCWPPQCFSLCVWICLYIYIQISSSLWSDGKFWSRLEPLNTPLFSPPQYILSGSDDFNLYMWKIPKDPEAGELLNPSAPTASLCGSMLMCRPWFLHLHMTKEVEEFNRLVPKVTLFIFVLILCCKPDVSFVCLVCFEFTLFIRKARLVNRYTTTYK